ncbi:uncharacterized protein J4E84_006606 [Alternaria hordeiaustralica]|uniref:uncharacterized protein n=1 Tax=Alternaria hordeiaustralica TaxID=1187925 RepID=UPI0020C4DFB5|nr:uncharacterized protein J4E84_006606 [Alternaria hordeiaustralica]KAI4683768.1 hypothetical protein J4E84_006606 [Alternaria hordeiaustralica]
MYNTSQTDEKADQDELQNPEKSDGSSPVDTETASEQTCTDHNSQNNPQGSRFLPSSPHPPAEGQTEGFMAPTSADEGGFHSQRPDDNGLSGVQGVSSKHDSTGSPAGAPFGQRHLESTQEWLSAVCGLFSLDNPVSVAIPSATTPTTEDATHEVRFQDDFLEWVKTTFELDDKDMIFIAVHLRRVHSSIALLVSEGYRAGEAIAEVKAVIKSISQQMAKLQQAQPDDKEHERTSEAALTELSTELRDEEFALRSQELDAEILRHLVMETVYAPLQTLVAQLKRTSDLKVAQLKKTSDSKDEEIYKLRVDKLFTHEVLSNTESNLNLTRYDAKTLDRRLATALKRVADTTTRVQELEQQNARLEKENADLKASKETTETPEKT